jgi:hypothetical protein
MVDLYSLILIFRYDQSPTHKHELPPLLKGHASYSYFDILHDICIYSGYGISGLWMPYLVGLVPGSPIGWHLRQ